MTLRWVFAMIARYRLLLRRYIAFCLQLSFCLRSSCKICKLWMKVIGEMTTLWRSLLCTPEWILTIVMKNTSRHECIFRIKGVVSKQNVRIWGNERADEHNPVVMNRPSVMTWCQLSNQRVISPYFFRRWECYRREIPKHASSVCISTFQQGARKPHFQQDGAPPHSSNRVTAHLNKKRQNNCAARGGPVGWPSRSPNLTPCDFLSIHIKSKRYATPISSTEEPKIVTEVPHVNQETLKNVWGNLKLRLGQIRKVEGGHI